MLVLKGLLTGKFVSFACYTIIGSSWGKRQELYERFFAGDISRSKIATYLTADKTDAINMVQRLLKNAPKGK